MANFYNWDTKQPIATLTVYKGQESSLYIGLYGGYVNGTWLDVTVSSRDGSNEVPLEEDPKKRVGYSYQAYILNEVKDGDIIRAKFNGALFAEPVTIALIAGGDNSAALNSGDPGHVFNDSAYTIDHQLPQLLPLRKSWSRGMGYVHGMAIHSTGFINALKDYQNFWDAKGTSAHFVIDRAGHVAQYVALSYRAWAVGSGNAHWISVEIVNQPDYFGKGAPMTDQQLSAASLLLKWLAGRYKFPLRLSAPYLAAQVGLGNVYKDYLTLAQGLSAANAGCGLDSPSGCLFSWGLSCHQWLQPNVKPCPGYEIIRQLPQLVRQAGGNANDM
jgi:hypothetical protein